MRLKKRILTRWSKCRFALRTKLHRESIEYSLPCIFMVFSLPVFVNVFFFFFLFFFSQIDSISSYTLWIFVMLFVIFFFNFFYYNSRAIVTFESYWKLFPFRLVFFLNRIRLGVFLSTTWDRYIYIIMYFHLTTRLLLFDLYFSYYLLWKRSF